MNDIHNQILNKLDLIECEHQVKIPLAIESGSRAWGFASPDSDYDCRFIYVRPKETYLSVFETKDTIDYVPDAVFDLNGWDLRKVIQHLVKSNAVMLEWLQSTVIYRRDPHVAALLWELGRAFFSPVSVSWHYLSMAKNKLEDLRRNEVSPIKRYFYILRPLACIRYIYEKGEIPFMEYQRNLSAITVPDSIREEIALLLAEKEQAKESKSIAVNPQLIAYFSAELDELERWLGGVKQEKNRDYAYADRCFRQIIGMVNEYGTDESIDQQP